MRTTSTYHNMHGTFRFGQDWSPQLKLAAKYAWVTRLGPFAGEAYWQHFLAEFMDWRGVRSFSEVRQAGDVMFLLLMAAVRWPMVLFRAMDQFQGFEPRRASAADWYGYLVRLLRVADGHSWKAMFDEIRVGRNSALTGLLWLCRTLGIVTLLSEEATEADAPPDRVLFLGVTQKKYILADVGPGTQRLEQIMVGVQSAGFAFPGESLPWFIGAALSRQEIRDYRDCVVRLVDLIVIGEANLSRGYVSRSLLSLLQREHGDHVWDDLNMSELAELLPDENNHLTPLLSRPAREVRTRFGFSPLAVSGMACLWGKVKSAHVEALQSAIYKDILNIVTCQPAEPMASSQVEAVRRGRVISFIPVPEVWVPRWHELHHDAR